MISEQEPLSEQTTQPTPEVTQAPEGMPEVETDSTFVAEEIPLAAELQALGEAIQTLKAEIGKLLVGQEDMVELLLAALLSDGHILIEGVPGVAKTLTAKLLAKSLALDFARLQFTPDLMPSDVLGTSVYNMQQSDFEFKNGPIFANLVLIDEINRAPAKTQSALFEVMEERQVSMDGQTYLLEAPFLVVATQNPIEQEGTYRLPEAQLDRFLFKIEVAYPSYEEEVQILMRHHDRKGIDDLDQVNAVWGRDEVLHYRQLVNQIHIDEQLIVFAVKYVRNTRENSDLYLGASPRASLYLMRAAKAMAAMRGRHFVKPEDITTVAPAVLRHRVMLTPDKEMEGATVDQVIESIQDQLEIPR